MLKSFKYRIYPDQDQKELLSRIFGQVRNMNLLKYVDYISEKVIYEMILESKVIFSNKFINLLSKMNNKVSTELLKIYSKDINVRQNYIDITDEKDAVSFTPDRKVQELLEGKPIIWEVIKRERHLTHSIGNNKIFKQLGYEKPENNPWSPNIGTFGLILGETISTVSHNTYVIFQEYGVEHPQKTVLNKVSLKLSEYDNKIWTTSRNNIKVGRLARAILTASKIKFVDRDIEEFTNKYKATFDFTKDILKQFDIVTGSKIPYWYDNSNEDKYVSGGGTLNNSCMAEVPNSFFDIYSKNKQVSLLILYGDDGNIKDGKYTDSRIKGRAVIWDATISRKSVTFMDRIYTVNDSDVELFKQFAEKNGWIFKKSQTMSPEETITDGKSNIPGDLVVKLDNGNFDNYPYTDTMAFLNMDEDILTNNYHNYHDRALRNTDGEWEDGY